MSFRVVTPPNMLLTFLMERPGLVRLGVVLVLFGLVLKLLRMRMPVIVQNLDEIGKRVEAGQGYDEEDVPEYDVVIVGGGTAGCVLASRLSADPSLTVLVLEAGESAAGLMWSRIPSSYLRLFGTNKVFNLFTTSQENAGGKEHYWPLGKMLGGCSSINSQIFQNAAPSDYDEWARIGGKGAESWAYKDFQKYFLKFEKFSPCKTHPDVDPLLRGSSGPVDVGFHGHHSPISQKFIESCVNVGIPLTDDFNTPKGPLGVAKLTTYISPCGRRVSTESAYLTPEVLARPNLCVAVGATVTRVLFDAPDEGEPRAVGVEFAATGTESNRFRVRATSEVIMSAGTIHTPQILMLSGVGPAPHLEKHDIPVIADLPGVGAHLVDHPVVDVAYADKSGSSLNYLLQPAGVYQWVKWAGALLRYFVTGAGPMTTNVAEATAFLRSDDTKLFPPDPKTEGETLQPENTTSGPDAPDLEFFVSPMGYVEQSIGDLPKCNSLGLHMTLLRPMSVGNITLKSADPFDAPAIDPKYLSNPNDAAILLRAMELLTRVAQTAPIADIIDHTNADPRLGSRLSRATPEEMREYIRTHVQTLFHPTSTARMAPLAAGGVVDARLRVHGMRALRIADASIFPSIVAGHTGGPTIAVAEKAADMITDDLNAH